MKSNYLGLDILRGIGIFVLLVMHTAFYYFGGLFELDLENPPFIVTLIGLMLMFAGVFAMISGLVHTHQHTRKIKERNLPFSISIKHNVRSGLFILVIAYLYFIITGPGLVHMDDRFMSNSILVELFSSRQLIGTTLERMLYVDSLVMIGMNILLLGLFFRLHYHVVKKPSTHFYLFAALLFFVLSLIRIPLYNVYLDALDAQNWFGVLSLNWLVNKNNPIFPYLSFALVGAWISTLLVTFDFKGVIKRVLPLGLILFILGIALYILLPDTMLQRAIDPVWFALMIAQNGLFMMFILVALKVYDFGKQRQLSLLSRFFRRFGVAGLSIFFIESVVSAAVYALFRLMNPNLNLDIPQALLFGLTLAFLWGGVLIMWEKVGYKYGIEYFYTRFLRASGGSEKENKLLEKLS
jgi:hypothetical protein